MKFTVFFCFLSVVAIGQTEFEKTEQYLLEKHYLKAQNTMIAYVKNNSEDPKGIELLGDVYGHQKKWDDAILSYKRLVDLSPKTANYHYKYGGALGMKALSVSKLKAMGIIGDVRQAFTNAANLDPKHIETRWALVELYMQLPGIIGGSKSKSLKYAEELQNLSKVDGFLAKGYIHEYDKEYELAEKHYKLAISEGGSLVCFEKLTLLYEHQNQPNKAIANMEAAYIKHETNLLNYQLGKVSADHNVQLEKGEIHLKKYLTNFSKKDNISKAWANYRLAQIYRHQKRSSDALSLINRSLTESPKEDAFKKEKLAILNMKQI